ncbi:signal peptidase I [Sphingomonas metalli]|uniref:Signal peptidase I n=1 Tax=Sphingomonas metalli TaxID=1779358 RepID=A0A916T0L6_9SPHN|nr:signal peptidase I [Sphingomonas metalli]GGB22406.1 signal peptidase I [Sphingomonas metalli]
MADPKPATATAPRSEAGETLRFFVKLALIVLIFRSFILAPFSIPSESMLPRLLIGDYLFVSKWNYGFSRWSLPWGFIPVPGRIGWATPARGDVVVFRSPGPDDHDVIKRVIGLPGDTVQMRGGQLFLNGRAIPKQRIADFVLPLSPNFDARHCDPEFQQTEASGRAVCRYRRYRETLPGGRSYDVLDQRDIPQADDTGVYIVPAGNVFLMGDNRDDSADSRFAPPEGMGFIPLDRVEGRAMVTFFSTDGSAEWLKPWTWVSAARGSRIGEGF